MHIGILGGGAAGMMAAIAAREVNSSAIITLFERNAILGKKVRISGGGRCNVTTGITDVRTVLTRYPRGGKFLTQAMYAFPPARVQAWFTQHGVPLVTEPDLRVFPASHDGDDIVGACERYLAEHHVTVACSTSITSIERNSGGFLLTSARGETFFCDRIILTTGGQAYRATGSTGDGYTFAEHLGHRITPLAPSLHSLFLREPWIKELAGTTLPHLRITTSYKDQTFSHEGAALFTHHGITGPGVFAFSAKTAFIPCSPQTPRTLRLHLLPEKTEDELFALLKELAQTSPKKIGENIPLFELPHRVLELLISSCEELPQKTPLNAWSKHQLRLLAHRLSHLEVTAYQRGAGDEFVTAGGVATDEVSPRTMESQKCPNLFFAGELLDIDGFTGGFNLQASWATGHLAGTSAGRT